MGEPLLVPEQESGGVSDTEHRLEFEDEQAACRAFYAAKHRLLDVNHWQDWAGSLSAAFRLTDADGHDVQRQVQPGDHFCIDIPGPGSTAGEGHDWVQVEAIDEKEIPNGHMIAIRVRPARNPLRDKDDVAHFFSPEASSTFSITRQARTIVAAVHGRNEKPNLGTEKVIDKVRNAVVATGAILGLNKPQWTALVKGILQFDPVKD